ncbi:phosphopantothenoylcysteine synthase [Verrucomicrobia bacterium LW23]|nr:phosphopantothenoylcysteine synthase [Verrucomicrobia bacterium LW23]
MPSQDPPPPLHLVPPVGEDDAEVPAEVVGAGPVNVEPGPGAWRGTQPRLVLAVTGSIAAFRAADIASALTKDGVHVDTILTESALKFVTPLTFQALTRRDAFTDASPDMRDGQPLHISLADNATMVLIAPATAHIIAQYAQGLAPDLLTSTLLALPPVTPVLIAPAMNGKMWLHPAVQANVVTLRSRGVEFVGPDQGLLACGYEGIGRMDPVDRIIDTVRTRLNPSPERA